METFKFSRDIAQLAILQRIEPFRVSFKKKLESYLEDIFLQIFFLSI